MPSREIKSVVVTYDDDTTQQWVGRGSVRTHVTEPRGGKEGSVRYIDVTLDHSTPEATPE